MGRVALPESKLKSRKRRRRYAAAGVWAFLFLFICVAVVGLLYLPHWRIVAVEVVGAEGTEAQAVKKAVQAQLGGYYWLVVPRDNVLVYPYSAINAELLAEFPTFSSVAIKAKNLRTLGVEVVERAPVALWCGEARASGAPCFLLDEKGVAYEPAARTAAYTSYYGKATEGPVPKQYIDEEKFRSLTALILALEGQQKGKATSVEVDSASDVSVRFASGFELRFALKDGGGDVFERFVLALGAEPFKGRQLSDFEYLDLRFGDRLYYKLKGE